MGASPDSSRNYAPLNNFLFLLVLFLLSLSFFALVRDNSFWHSGDYYLLNNAIRTEGHWKSVFETTPFQSFQPLVNFIFHLEYDRFGTNAWMYYLFNICIHSLNAFLVYFIVLTLLRDRTIAILSSLLFVFAVGNYGKAVMVVSGISDLIITLLTLLSLLFYFKNELEKGGKLVSLWFFAAILFFFLGLLTKATSFSVLGCMLVFNALYRVETKKSVLHTNFLVITVFALTVLIIKLSFLPHAAGSSTMVFFDRMFFKNFGSYLVRMVFPIHGSRLVSHAGPVVHFIYDFATTIRIATFLCILSYSIFGFIFGNRAIRFFIAWTYIMVLPFCFFRFPDDWLNIRYLYLVSVGFNLILASGTVLASRLLYQRPLRRLIPYLIPAVFIGMSYFIITHLDKNYEEKAQSPQMQIFHKDLMEKTKDKNIRD